jgi:hypothetical protein
MADSTVGSIISFISKAAPFLGSLFGPVGTGAGALVGTGLKMVAAALGVEPTQDAVADAIATDPAAALKLKEFEFNNKLELQKLVVQQEMALLQADTSRIQAVNATMQTEAAATKWPVYSWRPFWGFISGAAFFIACALICIMAWRAIELKDTIALSSIPLIITAFAALFAIPGAILGIASYKRGDMQIEQAKLGNAVDNKSQDK